MSGWRTLTESHEYTAQCAKIGNIERLDEALVGLTWGIANSPESFPIVEGCIRLAKTRALIGAGDKRVVVRIWFMEISKSEIELLAIHSEPIE